ncbi:MAG: L,D-transpeptidase [Nitrospira sp.]|nr:L,D-transpeptidase [Nitrospira sp.]
MGGGFGVEAARRALVRRGERVMVFALMAALPIATHPAQAAPLRGLCAVLHPSDERIEWECRTLRAGESLERLFGERWVDVARFNRVDRRHTGPGVSIKVPKQVEDLAEFEPLPLVYPPAEGEAKFILIDLSEQFLGAYEYGALRFSLPITSGARADPDRTPTGEFRISAAHRRHRSSLYTIEGTERPYPMNYALRFYTSRAGVSYWIHGRDVPGYPASHGCIGLYDEPMQKEQYGMPRDPKLNDAKRLFEWVLGNETQDDRLILLPQGPRVHIIGRPPGVSPLKLRHR